MTDWGRCVAASAAVVPRDLPSSRPSAKRSVGASRLAFTMGCHLATSLEVSSYLRTRPRCAELCCAALCLCYFGARFERAPQGLGTCWASPQAIPSLATGNPQPGTASESGAYPALRCWRSRTTRGSRGSTGALLRLRRSICFARPPSWAPLPFPAASSVASMSSSVTLPARNGVPLPSA